MIAGSRASDPLVNGRGGIVINLAASFRWRDEMMARRDLSVSVITNFLYFFIHSVVRDLKNIILSVRNDLM